MELDKAKKIYAYPKGHSREELKACIQALNEASQPIELNITQFIAIGDALNRLKVLGAGNGKA